MIYLQEPPRGDGASSSVNFLPFPDEGADRRNL